MKPASERCDGYAMAALLVMLAVMSVMLTVALPVWRQTAQREKEAELIFRGQQYARAIALFQRKYANAFPPSVDVLVEQRFLRKKYKDPITGDDFQVLPASALSLTPTSPQVASRPGAIATPISPSQPGRGGSPGASPSAGPFATPFSQAGPAAGGIAGVASKSKDQSIRLYNGRQHYNEWHFTYQAFMPRQPGVAPGMPGGTVRPGGAPGPARPGATPLLPGTPNIPSPTIPRRPN